MDSINAVRHILGVRKAVFVTGEIVTLGVLGNLVAACGFSVHGKFSAALRRFDLRFAAIRMLDDGDIALDDLLGHIVRRLIMLHGIELRLCADLVNGGVQQIALRRGDFPHCPVIVTDIFLGHELAVLIGGIGVHKSFALVNTVDRTGKRSVTLCRAGFGIAFGDGHGKLLEDVGKATVGDFVPKDGCALHLGNHIANGGVHFLYGIGCSAGNKDILKGCNAVFVGDGVLVHGNAGERSAVQVEGHALHKAIFRGLDDLQVATLELIVEVHGGNLTGNHGNTARFLRLIFVVAHLRHGVDTGHQVIDLNLTLGVGLDRLIDPVAGNGKGEVIYLAVLRGLDDLGRAVADLQIEKCLHRVIDFLGVADDILNTASGSVSSICPSNDTSAGCSGLACCNSYAVRGCGSRRNDELVSADAERNAILIRRKAIIGKDIVAVGQSCGVVRTVPSKLDTLRLAGSFRHKAGNSRVTLYACFNAVVVADELAIQRVRCADNALYGIITARTDMIEILITFTNYGFPNKHLRCHCLCQRCGIACVLRTPRGADRSRVAVLHNTPDEQLHIVGRNGAVKIRGKVIPKGFILAGILVASILLCARLNAITYVTVI